MDVLTCCPALTFCTPGTFVDCAQGGLPSTYGGLQYSLWPEFPYPYVRAGVCQVPGAPTVPKHKCARLRGVASDWRCLWLRDLLLVQ